MYLLAFFLFLGGALAGGGFSGRLHRQWHQRRPVLGIDNDSAVTALDPLAHNQTEEGEEVLGRRIFRNQDKAADREPADDVWVALRQSRGGIGISL